MKGTYEVLIIFLVHESQGKRWFEEQQPQLNAGTDSAKKTPY